MEIITTINSELYFEATENIVLRSGIFFLDSESFVKVVLYTLFIEGQKKKALKKFGMKTWCTKKPFGYRVVRYIF